MKDVNLKVAALASVVLMLTACGGGGGGGSSSSAKPLNVITVSGTTMALDGTWVSPCDPTLSLSGADGSVSTMVFNGSTVTVTSETWTGDPNCKGTATDTSGYTATGSVDAATGAIAGWDILSIDSGGNPVFTPTVAPQAEDGSGPLSNTESFSVINENITAVSGNFGLTVGTPLQNAYVSDNTGSNAILYFVGYDNTVGTVGVTNGYYVASGSSSSSKIYLVTASGGAIQLDGSWNTGCVPTASDSFLASMSVSSTTWTYSYTAWTGNTACSGTSTQTNLTADLTASATSAISGWQDNTGASATGPAAADGSGALANNVAYTPLSGMITSSDDPNVPVGAQILLGFVVDNSGSTGPLLYSASDPTAAWNYGPFQ